MCQLISISNFILVHIALFPLFSFCLDSHFFPLFSCWSCYLPRRKSTGKLQGTNLSTKFLGNQNWNPSKTSLQPFFHFMKLWEHSLPLDCLQLSNSRNHYQELCNHQWQLYKQKVDKWSMNKEIMQRKRNQCCFEDSPHPIVDNIMSYDVTDAL